MDVVAGTFVVLLASAVLWRLAVFVGKPFFYDEGWRAYCASRGQHFLDALRDNNAPLALGWILAAKAAALLAGNVEQVLRATTFVLLPPLALATWWLARRVSGPVVATVAAVALATETAMLVYTTMFKSYTGEALCTVIAVGLWPALFRSDLQLRWRLAIALLVGLLPVYSIPTFFVVAALTVWQSLAILARDRRSLRQVAWWGRTGAPAAAVLILTALPGLLHLATFVRLQSHHVHTSVLIAGYWYPFYLPTHVSVGQQAHWVWTRLGDWVPGFVTNGAPEPRDHGMPHLQPHTGPLASLLTASILVALAAGLVAARRRALLRPVVVAIAGSTVEVLALSSRQLWPFGWERVNLFVLPLLYVLMAAGVSELWVLRRAHLPRARRALTSAAAVAVLTLASAVTWAGAGAALAISRSDLSAIRSDVGAHGTADGMRDVGLAVREVARPGDIAVAEISSTVFSYYVLDYEGYPAAVLRRRGLDDEHIFQSGRFDDPTALDWVRLHRAAPHLFVFESTGVTGRLHEHQLAAFRALGYRVIWVRGFAAAGVVSYLARD